MSDARARMRVRAMVGLYREKTIETLPIDEVRADLARLGVDPAPLIALARRLADGSVTNPAASLLQKLERTEAIDAEIAALEQAPIDSVLSSLEASLPAAAPAETDDPVSDAATSDAVPAETDQPVKAGEAPEADEPTNEPGRGALDDDTTVVPFIRRRAVLGWGGSLAGIAACLLIFFAIRPDGLERADRERSLQPPAKVQPLGDVAQPAPLPDVTAERALGDRTAADAVAEADASPPIGPRGRQDLAADPAEPPAPPAQAGREEGVSEEGRVLAEAEPPVAADPPRPKAAAARTATAAASSAEGEGRTPPVDAAIAGLQSEPELPAPMQRDRDEVALAGRQDVPQPSHQPVLKPALPEAATALAQPPLQEAATAPAREPAPPVAAAAFVPAREMPQPETTQLPHKISGVFVVDSARAPAELKALERDRRDDRLAARLAEASLRALGRKVLALVAFERDGKRVEAALVSADQSIEEVADLQGQAASFELLELSN
ncbi:MAG: hypothetical protein R3F54_24330 [Alphaproteobacteria bacterium]